MVRIFLFSFDAASCDSTTRFSASSADSRARLSSRWRPSTSFVRISISAFKRNSVLSCSCRCFFIIFFKLLTSFTETSRLRCEALLSFLRVAFESVSVATDMSWSTEWREPFAESSTVSDSRFSLAFASIFIFSAFLSFEDSESCISNFFIVFLSALFSFFKVDFSPCNSVIFSSLLFLDIDFDSNNVASDASIEALLLCIGEVVAVVSVKLLALLVLMDDRVDLRSVCTNRTCPEFTNKATRLPLRFSSAVPESMPNCITASFVLEISADGTPALSIDCSNSDSDIDRSSAKDISTGSSITRLSPSSSCIGRRIGADGARLLPIDIPFSVIDSFESISSIVVTLAAELLLVLLFRNILFDLLIDLVLVRLPAL
mmetsp:Transcript_24190/g.36923  ORF Transcript_24190/g.36923 Transcript_24190/m.36923 type:complete len:374 (-) Transcript_24190:310-1431(-)